MKKPNFVVEKQQDGRYCVIDTSVGVISEDIEDLEMAEQEAAFSRECEVNQVPMANAIK